MADLRFKKTPEQVEEEAGGSYIRLTGALLERFTKVRHALGHEGNRGVKEVGVQVAEFGLDAIEKAITDAGIDLETGKRKS
jgi:hypothetical protein